MITNLCTGGVKHTFPIDQNGVRTDRMPALQGIGTLADYPLVVIFSAGSTNLIWWIMYARERVGLTMGRGLHRGRGHPALSLPAIRPAGWAGAGHQGRGRVRGRSWTRLESIRRARVCDA